MLMRRVLLVLAVLCFWAAPAAADVLGVRAAAKPGGARLVVDLSRTPAYRAFTLANPARIVVDLADTKWRAEGVPPRLAGVAGLRHGAFRPTVYRLVFDLERAAAIVAAQLVPGDAGAGKSGVNRRLVVDLAYGGATKQRQFGDLRFSRPKRQMAPAPRPEPIVRTIVLDAGHGGVDPGAIGVGGVVEKRVVLAVAKAVKRHLTKRAGYRVRLTRDRDTFLRLRERVRRGRAAGADLFISIHADSHPDRHVAGASLYTLSEKASDREAARLARAENRADLIGGVTLDEEPNEVVDILLDLTQRETKNQSSTAADDLLFALAGDQALLARPKRAAGFAVLKAPDVPSVLIELGFLSNAADARRLGGEVGRERIARAIAQGVFRYFDGANTARSLTANIPR